VHCSQSEENHHFSGVESRRPEGEKCRERRKKKICGWQTDDPLGKRAPGKGKGKRRALPLRTKEERGGKLVLKN